MFWVCPVGGIAIVDGLDSLRLYRQFTVFKSRMPLGFVRLTDAQHFIKESLFSCSNLTKTQVKQRRHEVWIFLQ